MPISPDWSQIRPLAIENDFFYCLIGVALASIDCIGKYDVIIEAGVTCATFFYYCYDNLAHRIQCPPGTIYHPVYSACLDANVHVADCASNN